MAVGREKQQGHQDIEQRGDIEEDIHRQPQDIPQAHLQQEMDRHLQDCPRYLRAVGRHREGRGGQQQDQAAFDEARDTLPTEHGVEEDKSAHPGQDHHKQGQLRPIQSPAS